ncbi:MAG: hypothetical protein M3O82_02160, partial [Verrucomicrobiota bacterium]|nr:hypothetical protein [Verrucomicrobiota bacterium]
VLCSGDAIIGGPSVPAVVVLSGDADSMGVLRSRSMSVKPGAVIAMTGSLLSIDENLTVEEGGSIQGTGEIICGGTITNNGFISPGLSPGILTVRGNLVVGATGVINAEVAGLTAGTKADQLIVDGDLTMNGTLNLQFINGYAPRTGDTLQVLNVSGAVSGDLTNVVIGGLEPITANFARDFQNGVLTITAQNDTVALPVVSLRRAPKSLREKPPKTGAVLLARTGSTAADLAVQYSIGGTQPMESITRYSPERSPFPQVNAQRS